MRVSRATRGTARDGHTRGIFDDSDGSDVETGEEGTGQSWSLTKPLPKWSSGFEVDLRDGGTLPKGMELVGTQDHVFREQDDGTMALFLPAVRRNHAAAHAPTRAPPRLFSRARETARTCSLCLTPGRACADLPPRAQAQQRRAVDAQRRRQTIHVLGAARAASEHAPAAALWGRGSADDRRANPDLRERLCLHSGAFSAPHLTHLIPSHLRVESTYTPEAMTRPLTLTVCQCTRDCGAMGVDRNHKEGGRHK